MKQRVGDMVGSAEQMKPVPAHAAALGLSFIPGCRSLSHSRALR